MNNGFTILIQLWMRQSSILKWVVLFGIKLIELLLFWMKEKQQFIACGINYQFVFAIYSAIWPQPPQHWMTCQNCHQFQWNYLLHWYILYEKHKTFTNSIQKLRFLCFIDLFLDFLVFYFRFYHFVCVLQWNFAFTWMLNWLNALHVNIWSAIRDFFCWLWNAS